MQLIERIRQAYPTYNKTRKRIASCILNNPAKCCFLSLKEFSALTETAELTILNFCKSVGADGYIELRHQLQEYVMQWSHPLDRINALQATENGGEEEFYQNIWNRERHGSHGTKESVWDNPAGDGTDRQGRQHLHRRAQRQPHRRRLPGNPLPHVRHRHAPP